MPWHFKFPFRHGWLIWDCLRFNWGKVQPHRQSHTTMRHYCDPDRGTHCEEPSYPGPFRTTGPATGQTKTNEEFMQTHTSHSRKQGKPNRKGRLNQRGEPIFNIHPKPTKIHLPNKTYQFLSWPALWMQACNINGMGGMPPTPPG